MIECEMAARLNQGANAIKACTETLQRDPRRVDALLHRATGHELSEDFDAAIRDIKAVCVARSFSLS